jgi:hypothetical protein
LHWTKNLCPQQDIYAAIGSAAAVLEYGISAAAKRLGNESFELLPASRLSYTVVPPALDPLDAFVNLVFLSRSRVLSQREAVGYPWGGREM